MLPRPVIEPSSPSEASNPFSGTFKVANSQVYPLEDVRIEAELWCAKLGRGTDTSPPDLCPHVGMPSSRKAWNQRTIGPDAAYQINIGEVLYATPGALLSADLSVKVSYRPWVLPFHLSKESRFYSRRKDDGTIEWLQRPNDGA